MSHTSSTIEFTGWVTQVRAVEDVIRASKKYTKVISPSRNTHPIQGDEFAGRVVTEKYEVYPDVKVEWDMPALKAWASLVFAETKMIDVVFHYDYRNNKAYFETVDGLDGVEELKKAIPGFSEAIDKLLRKDVKCLTSLSQPKENCVPNHLK
jgi:hypothetical protein